MLLLFDAGNTRLKWAVADSNNSLLDTGAIDYAEAKACIENLALHYKLTHIAISSVADEQRNELIVRLCKQYVGVEPVFASVTSQACDVKNKYQAQDRLGVDRWVAAMGAAAQLGVNRVIVDAGTAVTVDLIDSDNAYLGGVILPGAKLMHDSLVGETAGIYSQRESVSEVIGQTTQQCVNAGVQFGLVGAIERVIIEIHALKFNDDPWQVLLCGGDASLIVGLLRTELAIACCPNLIFDGLLNLYNSGELK